MRQSTISQRWPCGCQEVRCYRQNDSPATKRHVHYMLTIFGRETGCMASLEWCVQANTTERRGQSICDEAAALCRKLVEGPFERLSGRSAYDIRAAKGSLAELPSEGSWVRYVNSVYVQDALVVDLNYTSPQSVQVLKGFYPTGDHASPGPLADLKSLLAGGVRVALVYGDAVCGYSPRNGDVHFLLTEPLIYRTTYVTGSEERQFRSQSSTPERLASAVPAMHRSSSTAWSAGLRARAATSASRGFTMPATRSHTISRRRRWPSSTACLLVSRSTKGPYVSLRLIKAVGRLPRTIHSYSLPEA